MSHYLTQSLHRAVRSHPDRLATIFGERRRSYRDMTQRVARLAGALRRLGVGADERVSLLALNSDRYIETLLATFWAGAIVNTLNTRWSGAEICYALNDSQSSVLLVDDNFVGQVAAITAHASSIRHLIYIGDGDCPPGMLSYEALIAAGPAIEDAWRHGDDLALIQYTGGTTGFPKGAMLSHANLVSASLGVSAAGCGMGAIHLHAVPLFHIAGLQILFNALIGGSTHVVLPGFSAAAVLRAIEQERATSAMLVPTMLQMLVEHPDLARHDLGSLERMVYGASPISAAVLDRAMAALPRAEFIQGYGMTETCLTVMLPGRYHTPQGRKLGKLGSAGLVLPATELKIVDDNGVELPPGSPGEILVRGPMVMRGYWQQPEQTAQALSGGWMHTGDVGMMDAEGFVFIVDRLKDMIISGGENVYSSEVEDALARHPAVSMCAVIGIPDERWGERVHAVIVLKPGMSVTADEIMRHCQGLIAGYKCPRSIEFRDSLPLSAAGKLLKNVVREPFWQGHARKVN